MSRRWIAGALVVAACATLLATHTAEAQTRRGSVQRERVERFRGMLRAFAADLEEARPGLSRSEARRIAYTSVSEAMRHGVPPSLVFGVLLQESTGRDESGRATLNSRAVSVVGAKGLMQIMPKWWLEDLGPLYGYDLFAIETNVQFGVHILAHYLKAEDGVWYRAVDAYSGGARRYAQKVRAHVLRHGRRICASRDFRRCVSWPAQRRFGS